MKISKYVLIGFLVFALWNCKEKSSENNHNLTAEQMKECGIGEDFMRLSVGLEDVDDIIADLDSALDF